MLIQSHHVLSHTVTSFIKCALFSNAQENWIGFAFTDLTKKKRVSPASKGENRAVIEGNPRGTVMFRIYRKALLFFSHNYRAL